MSFQRHSFFWVEILGAFATLGNVAMRDFFTGKKGLVKEQPHR